MPVLFNPARHNLRATIWTPTFDSSTARQLLSSVGVDVLLVGNPREAMPRGIPFRLDDYLELVDWTGRQLRDDKRSAIEADLPPILERLAIEPKRWLSMSQHFESRFKGLVGTAYAVKAACRLVSC